MKDHIRVVVALAVATPVATNALAQLVPVTQTRTHDTRAYVFAEDEVSDAKQDAADDFGLFDSSNICSVHLGSSSAEGFARQFSSIDPLLLEGELATGTDVYAGIPEEYAEASGSSSFALWFDILTPQTWLVSAQGGAIGGLAYASLHISGGTIDRRDFHFDDSESVAFLLDLGPGRYLFSTIVAGGASASGTDAQSASIAELSYRMEYIAPAPGTLALIPAWLVMLRRRR